MRALVRVLVIAGVVAGVPAAAAMGAQHRGLRIERVFGPEVPTGRYKHPASITELRSGDLYLVYYGGEGEYATDTAVFGARLTKGMTSWSAPAAIARDPFRSLGNAVIWQGPDGLVWLFYVVRFGETWSTSRIQAKVSRDEARTWSDAFMISPDEGMMVRNRPIVLSNGDYLLPVYHETGHDTEAVGPDSTSLFLRYDVRKKRWTPTGRIRSRTGNIQPAVVEISESHLIAYSRRGGGYGATNDGYLVRAESHDGGATWSEGRNSAFPNPNSAIEFLELAGGSLLLVYNDSMTQRTPLTSALSTDGDRTYAYRRNIAEGRDSFAYPIGFQAADGLIHIVYTSQQRTVINHATFSEAWVKGTALPGSPAAPGASPAPASFAAQQAPNPRQQPGAQVHIYAPEQHDLYDGHFVISANRIYMVGGLNDPEGWDHLDNEAKNVRPVAGTAEIDVNEIQNTGTFTAKLKIPEGDLVLTMDRWHQFSPCQNGGIVAYVHEHGTDSGCGDNNWPKTLGFLAGWGFGHATLNGKPLYQDYEMHFMVTQGLRDRKTLRVNYPLATKKLPGGETNPATQQIDFYIRSPQPNPKNKPARQVFLHFFGMEITWK